MRPFIALAGVALLAGIAGCEPYEEACDEYVDYVCECHEGEEGFDCDELRQTFANADPDVQEQCSIDLTNLQADDEATGHVCTADDSGL